MRLGFVGLCILAGGGLLLYIVALIIIPRAPEDYDPSAQAPPYADAPPPETDTPDPAGASAEDSSDGGTDSDTPTMI